MSSVETVTVAPSTNTTAASITPPSVSNTSTASTTITSTPNNNNINNANNSNNSSNNSHHHLHLHQNVSQHSAEIATTPAIDTSAGHNTSTSSQKMNGLTLSELCCLFCCPPCPGRIAAKLAFLPPEPTYSISPDPNNQAKFTLKLSERADWQYNQRELDAFEVFYATSSRGNRIACECFFVFVVLVF